MRGVKREVVQGEDELGQAGKGGSIWGWFRPLIQEEADSPKTILVGNGHGHVCGKKVVDGACKLEILKLAFSIRGIADVRGQGLDWAVKTES
eukprot:g22431.t1